MNLNIRVDVYHHQCGSGDELQHIATLLAAMTEQFKTLTLGVGKMAGELEALQTKVAEITAEAADNQAKFDVIASTLTALVTKLIELQGQPDALVALAAQLDAAKQAIDVSQSSVDDELAAAQAVLNPPAPPAP